MKGFVIFVILGVVHSPFPQSHSGTDMAKHSGSSAPSSPIQPSSPYNTDSGSPDEEDEFNGDRRFISSSSYLLTYVLVKLLFTYLEYYN